MFKPTLSSRHGLCNALMVRFRGEDPCHYTELDVACVCKNTNFSPDSAFQSQTSGKYVTAWIEWLPEVNQKRSTYWARANFAHLSKRHTHVCPHGNHQIQEDLVSIHHVRNGTLVLRKIDDGELSIVKEETLCVVRASVAFTMASTKRPLVKGKKTCTAATPTSREHCTCLFCRSTTIKNIC